jgi:stalled ribosome rescue protein Dom34
MKDTKRMGIWMDHSNAILMDLTKDTIAEKNVISDFMHQERAENMHKSEKLINNKERQQQSEYYKILGNSIKKYKDVVLFGPTDAKDELLELLKSDVKFKNIKIESKHADNMTENQMHDFVKAYFGS